MSQGQVTGSFVLFSTLGGECSEDIERLRQDKVLKVMLGYRIPTPETARQCLDKFQPKRLWFAIFTQTGMECYPAGETFLRLADSVWQKAFWIKHYNEF